MSNIDLPIEGSKWTFTYWIPGEDRAGNPIVPMREDGILVIEREGREMEIPISTLRLVLKNYDKTPLERLRIVFQSIKREKKKDE